MYIPKDLKAKAPAQFYFSGDLFVEIFRRSASNCDSYYFHVYGLTVGIAKANDGDNKYYLWAWRGLLTEDKRHEWGIADNTRVLLQPLDLEKSFGVFLLESISGLTYPARANK